MIPFLPDRGVMTTTSAMTPIPTPQFPARRLIAVTGLALALAYVAVLAGTYLQGQFLTDTGGRPIANDFVGVFAAGRLALDGRAVTAYDWPVHKAAEVQALHHDFDGYYGWHYPPTFLFVAAALALLPYLGAALAWLVATLAAYAATLRFIVADRSGLAVALGFPATIWNITAGQNGFLTAALIGGTLGLLERRPALAGVLLGLLTYKPQFGLLFPLLLIADRRWHTIAIAGLTAAGMAALSWIVFGGASWQAFFHWMPITSRIVLGEGGADWSRLQSVFGLIRAHGGSETLGWIAQGAVSLIVAVWVLRLWRKPVPFALKAASLAAGTLIVTPYVYTYDLVVLAVAVAFLLRDAFERGFGAGETACLAAASSLILIYPYVRTQVGLVAILMILVVVAQRARAQVRRTEHACESGQACEMSR